MISHPREQAQKEGFRLLSGGHYKQAQKLLEQTIEFHGSHVSVHSDLAFAYYLGGDMNAFRLSVERLEAEFRSAGGRLSTKSRILTLITLAKFSEELGKVAAAVELSERACALLTAGDPLDLRVRSQLLRLLASFGRSDEISTLYRDCLQASESRPQELIECFHALLLAESRLFGLSAAWPRFLELSKRPDLQKADLRLCLLDLLEIALETGDKLSRQAILEFLADSPAADELDPFEKELLKMAGPKCRPATQEDFFHWTRQVSPLCHLRLLALEATRPGGSHDAARSRLAIQLESFDHKTRLFLSRKWRSAFQGADSINLLVSEELRMITTGSKELAFSKRAQPWELLRALEKQADGALEGVLDAMGKRDSESERESLRIQCVRLNKKLVGLAGLDWVIRFTKNKLQLHPSVRIRFD